MARSVSESAAREKYQLWRRQAWQRRHGVAAALSCHGSSGGSERRMAHGIGIENSEKYQQRRA